MLSYTESMQMPQSRKTRHQTNWIVLSVLAICSFALAYWTQQAGRQIDAIYADVMKNTAKQSSVVARIQGDVKTIIVPTWDLFHKGQLWEYIGKSAPRQDVIQGALIDTPVKASDEGDMRVDVRIKSSLIEMFKAAEADGTPLMLSSAYRSRDDQQKLYDLYLTLQGRTYVDSYVALPGTSEHETGLVIDIASESPDCLKDSDKCNLHPNSIAWLSKNAARFGFLQRYPSGKQSITGIAGEAWHYRYVGRTLAEFLDQESLTFDEFVHQVAPGYTKINTNLQLT